ncbi:MAG: alpha-amlyase [Spirochaetaceae bacterium]|nr:MAG: alpha-amlyase [Spirochaetaceae bacterium]
MNCICFAQRTLEVAALHPITGRSAEREFHVARAARDKYQFQHPLFTLRGNVVFADFHAARLFAQAINQTRDLSRHPDQAARAGDINAMGLIDEIMHHVILCYLDEFGDDLMAEAREFLISQIGEQEIDRTLLHFCRSFPPREVYQDSTTCEAYLEKLHDGVPGRDLALEELIMLWIENQNPAYAPYAELFPDRDLTSDTAYANIIQGLQDFFADKPAFGPENLTLIETLLAPIKAHPHSLDQQLAYIRRRWSSWIGRYLFRLLRSLDLIAEERKAHFSGAGPAQVIEYGRRGVGMLEYERFSPDTEWMPNVVMLAKSTLVWLNQLSDQYGYEIRTLDRIPDQELDRLAAAGFNSLWLIGLWRRSHASRRIKQMCGNPDAEASAYSLLEYEVAEEIGGWPALENLRSRCNARGIRLASDMVPNHTGIDSPWVISHPDWFVQLPHSPFPSYTFNGENHSGVDGVGIYLEDHYYDRSDAAVVFRRVDFGSGRERYIYHGNDGTSMPWNDTAQLDFLNPDTREAVIQTILHVARNFPIIRFDAAMTLAKKHVQRLWYPEPGSGGDIASRSEHGLTAEEFDRAMPQEFWREVVDRVAEEVPDTLLLAEAFWMMESYFVRTLGMHRVYNSAFMHMLKNQDNQKYRQTIKNTLEFDPAILKRFVNFMNNPDEETAVVQFGKGDKYFGVATLMVTMPGLPMFGHGQVQGFAEKYGMEFRRAYWNEQPDMELVHRHERELFPLMRRRYQFSGVDRFRLYDLWGDHGQIHEDVYAYSNEAFGARSLVLYNNAYETVWGRLSLSAGYVEKDGHGNRRHRQVHLAEALGLHNDHRRFCIMYEQKSRLWYIRNSADLWSSGMFVNLQGYQTQVFVDIYEVTDNEFAHYARLADSLRGGGVPDVDNALKEIYLKPLHESFALVANSGVCQELSAEFTGQLPKKAATWDELRDNYQRFLRVAADYACGPADVAGAAQEFDARLRTLLATRHLELVRPHEHVPSFRKALHAFTLGLRETPARVSTMIALLMLKPLGVLVHEDDDDYDCGCEDGQPNSAAGLAEDLMLLTRLAPVLPVRPFENEDEIAWKLRVRILLTNYNWLSLFEQGQSARNVTAALLSDSDVSSYLGVNTHDGVVWYNKERMDTLIWWLLAVGMLQVAYDDIISRHSQSIDESPEVVMTRVLRLYDYYERLRLAHASAAYRVERLLEALDEPNVEVDT